MLLKTFVMFVGYAGGRHAVKEK